MCPPFSQTPAPYPTALVPGTRILPATPPPDTGFLQQDLARVTTFVLLQSTDATFATGVSANLLESPSTPTALSRVVTPLAKGSRYYFRLYTENVAGRSTGFAVTNEQSITVPSPPTIAAAITGELGGTPPPPRARPGPRRGCAEATPPLPLPQRSRSHGWHPPTLGSVRA